MINMGRLIVLSLFFCLSFCGILARSTPYEVDIQADYLNSLLNKAKLRPTVKGELNFSPNQNAFSNVVRSVAGKRVSDTSELVFEMKLFPEATSEVLRNAYIVFHASNSSAIVEGQVINISLRCETSATFHLLQSHTVTVEDEAEDWLELSLDMSSLPWPSSENCTFSAHTTGNCSSLDALLALYDYSEHGGLDIRSLVSNTVEKRSAGDGTNKTLLSEYTASGLNCSVQSIFLDYATGFPVFPRSIVVISPNRVGINMTFCFGTCSPVSAALPLNITSTERRLFVMQAASGPTPRACCVPDQIEHESLMIFDEELELVSIQSFPQVVTCHCVI